MIEAQVRLPPSFHTSTFCVGALSVRFRTRTTHGIAGFTEISGFFPAFRTNDVKLFNFVNRNIMRFSADGQLVIRVFPCPVAATP